MQTVVYRGHDSLIRLGQLSFIYIISLPGCQFPKPYSDLRDSNVALELRGSIGFLFRFSGYLLWRSFQFS